MRQFSRHSKIETPAILHPGEVLGEELAARGIPQKDFAELVDMRPPHLNELIKGKRHVSAILALKLEKHLGISAASGCVSRWIMILKWPVSN